MKDNNQRLYDRAVTFLGKDADPLDPVDDTVACVSSLEEVYHAEFQTWIGRIKLFNTIDLHNALLISPKFRRVEVPKPGNIIVSVTEYRNGKQIFGHTGVIAKYGILSNDSVRKVWLENFTVESWKIYYEGRLGLKTYFYELLP